MTTSDGTLLNQQYGISIRWNIPNAEDSIVRNGTVKVIGANGFKFTWWLY